jgi:signal peptide peptidase SppA
MKYQHVLSYIASHLWAMDPAKLHELLAVVAYRAAGHTFTPEEIQARIGDGAGSQRASSSGGVAVIPIRGVIANRMGAMDDTSGGTSCEAIGRMIDHVASDASIGTIVYDVDSPGGTVEGVTELAAKMFALDKRQIAMVNGMCCSAAYWLASQADEIVSMPSSRTGSVGVFCAHEDLSAALEKEGIKVTVISAGKFKIEQLPVAPLSDEARAHLQARVDETYALFVRDIARGREVKASEVRGGFGEGRALSAKDALAAGMIDRIGSMQDTIARLSGRGPARAGGLRAEERCSKPVLDYGATISLDCTERAGHEGRCVFNGDSPFLEGMVGEFPPADVFGEKARAEEAERARRIRLL